MHSSLSIVRRAGNSGRAIIFALGLGSLTGEAKAAGLEFDHPSGFYESGFRLSISTPTIGSAVYYTTNGSTPGPATGLRYQDSIPISATTILRAAAFNRDQSPIASAARTYLFIPSILNQTGAQFPQVWGTNAGRPIPAHYRMTAGEDALPGKMAAALAALPSFSIVTDPEHLFSPGNGIYLHPLERGVAWERPVMLEMFDPRGGSGFQINCGLRIHGGMSRHPEESPKHSFRLSFKRRYGEAKLRFPLFGPGGAQAFDDLVLRAGGNDSWLESNGDRRRRATCLRDEWMRQSMAAMGHPSARGRFVHLFLNGLYWGIYNVCEKPWESLLSGNRATSVGYDVRKGNQIEAGDAVAWNEMLALANAGLTDPNRYLAIQRLLNLAQFADYMILNFYAGNVDWDRSVNWVALRPRTPDGQFQFMVWDGEQTLGDLKADILDLDDDDSPLRLFQQLSENSAFRTLFASRAQHLLSNGGPLSRDAAAKRWRDLADSLAPAIPAETARWGNYRLKVHQFKTGPYEFYTADHHWQPQVNYLLSDYFPQRCAILLDQFRGRGLFPDLVK